jgi:hypothetical protein
MRGVGPAAHAAASIDQLAIPVKCVDGVGALVPVACPKLQTRGPGRALAHLTVGPAAK